MKAVTKQEWTDALRSGRYTQGRSLLRRYDEYCCLGVYCDLTQVPSHERGDGIFVYGEDECCASLPTEVEDSAHTAGLVMNHEGLLDLTARGAKHHISLATLNDTGLTFNQIADVIDYFL